MSVQRRRLHRHALEKGRVADVGGVVRPGEAIARGDVELLPAFVPAEDVGVLVHELLRRHRRQHRFLQFALARPDVLEVNRLAVFPVAEGFGGQVEVHRPGQRVRHHQRRGREVVRAHLLLHTAFEVPVAAEHRRDHEAIGIDRGRDVVGQRSAVADAGRAAVADQVEAELIEIYVEARLLQVVGDDFRSRRQAGLHPRLLREAFLDRLLRDEAGADHHARVRRVRAAGDRRDDDGTVLDGRLRRSGNGRAASAPG